MRSGRAGLATVRDLPTRSGEPAKAGTDGLSPSEIDLLLQASRLSLVSAEMFGTRPWTGMGASTP